MEGGLWLSKKLCVKSLFFTFLNTFSKISKYVSYIHCSTLLMSLKFTLPRGSYGHPLPTFQFLLFFSFYNFFTKNIFCKNSEAQIFKKLRTIQEQQQAGCKQSKNIMTMWLFETEMLKHKYIHSIVQQNKFNTNNIMFKFRNLYAPFMDENMYITIWIPQI